MENNEIARIRKDVNNLKEVVERMEILLNKNLICEMQEEIRNMESGESLTEEEFEKKHKVKIL